MKKRKYSRFGEKYTHYECTRWNCKWQGTDEEKELKRINEYKHVHVCPECGNDVFYGLI